jgi:hypothetical protein
MFSAALRGRWESARRFAAREIARALLFARPPASWSFSRSMLARGSFASAEFDRRLCALDERRIEIRACLPCELGAQLFAQHAGAHLRESAGLKIVEFERSE